MVTSARLVFSGVAALATQIACNYDRIDRSVRCIEGYEFDRYEGHCVEMPALRVLRHREEEREKRQPTYRERDETKQETAEGRTQRYNNIAVVRTALRSQCDDIRKISEGRTHQIVNQCDSWINKQDFATAINNGEDFSLFVNSSSVITSLWTVVQGHAGDPSEKIIDDLLRDSYSAARERNKTRVDEDIKQLRRSGLDERKVATLETYLAEVSKQSRP